MKTKKNLTPRQEIRELTRRIEELKDSHRVLLRKGLVPLSRRLAVLLAAEALRRAERALVRSIEADQANPQLELLSLAAPEQAEALPPLLHSVPGQEGNGNRLGATDPSMLLADAGRLGQ